MSTKIEIKRPKCGMHNVKLIIQVIRADNLATLTQYVEAERVETALVRWVQIGHQLPCVE